MLPPQLNLIFEINVLIGTKSNTITFLCALFYKTDIKAVQKCHKKSQIHCIQRAISLNSHSFQMSNKEQSVIFA